MTYLNPPEEPRTVSKVVGENIRHIRKNDLGLTLGELSQRLKILNLKWSTGRISDVESARSTMSLDTLLIFSIALTDLTKNVRVPPSRLLESKTPVEINKGTVITPENWVRVLEDGFVDGVITQESTEDAVLSLNRWTRSFKSPHDRFSLADQRAARKLGIDEKTLISLSVDLWGQLLSEETEERSPVGAPAQKKGRITRELLKELRDAMQDGVTDDTQEN